MAAISRYKAEQYVTKIFKEYLGALKEAKRNKKKLLPEANILFEGMDEFAGFINSNNLQQKVYNRLNLEGIKELFNEAKLLALYYDLESFTSVKDCEIDTDTPNDFQGWIVRLSSNGKVESIEYKNGNDVLEIFPDGKEEYHKYPGNGSRAGFLARYAGLSVLADGTSPGMERLLSENDYSYNEQQKLWVAGENANKKIDILEQNRIINYELPLGDIKSNRNGEKIKKVKAIVIHYVEKANQNPKDTIDFWKEGRRKGSAHYVISTNGQIYRAIPENEYARHAGTLNVKNYTDIATKLFGKEINPNYYSLGIEMVNIDSAGTFTKETIESAVFLAAKLLKKYGLNSDENLVRHYDITGKLCPLYYVNNPKEWENFKKQVNEKMQEL